MRTYFHSISTYIIVIEVNCFEIERRIEKLQIRSNKSIKFNFYSILIILNYVDPLIFRILPKCKVLCTSIHLFFKGVTNCLFIEAVEKAILCIIWSQRTEIAKRNNL